MENNTKMVELLLENAVEYGKTSCKLYKLKAIDKTSDVVSSFIPRFILMFFSGIFILFLSLGLALWLGEIFEKAYFGFFLIAAFYGFTGIFIRLFLNKRLKKIVCDRFIKQLLK